MATTKTNQYSLSTNENAFSSFAKNETMNLTPYEKILYDTQYDARFKGEESTGRRIGFYRIYKDIGLGNFSRVKLGLHLLAKEKVAIKILDKTRLDDKTQRLLLREITSMEKLHHPNIIRLYEVIENPKEIYIVTEYAPGGDLYTHITDNGKFTEAQAKPIFAQIVSAVEHMHSKGIIHRDIKSENVFFANEHLIKLGDFGFSTYSEKNQTLTTFCGSPPYAAPELYRDPNYVGIYVDIWPMGVTLYFMVTGLMPFRAENVGKLRQSVTAGNYSIPAFLSSQCKELIRGLLNSSVNDRWSIEKIRSCSWLTNQIFIKEFDPFPTNLSNYSLTSNRTTSSIQHQAHLKLRDLGITPSNIHPHTDTNRDNINGTYRIIFHRLQKQSNKLEHDSTYDKRMKEDITHNWARSISHTTEYDQRKLYRQSSIENSRACTIL